MFRIQLFIYLVCLKLKVSKTEIDLWIAYVQNDVYTANRELFYLMTHTTYFIYGVGQMVKDHWVREETCCCHYMGYYFLISSKGFFYMHHPIDRITHTTAFVTPVVEHWLEREIAQWVHYEGSIQLFVQM